MVIAVLATTARVRPHLATLDLVLLLTGLLVILVEQRAVLLTRRHIYPSDEGRLGQFAIDAVLHGTNPYTQRWPSVAAFAGNTPLYGGGGVTRFGYPPLGTELGAVFGRLWRPLGTPGVVDSLGLLGAAVLCFVVLPRSYRAVSVIVLVGLTSFTTYAVNGHPAMLALPLLCAACFAWTRIGQGGKLGRVGLVQAACLGLAAATQQLAWFIGIGLVMAIWLVRRGELDDGQALRVTGRFLGIALAAFILVDLPFAVANPHAWISGVLSVLTQHAVASGQGLVMLSVVVRAQAGHLEYYSYGAALLFLAVLAIVAVEFRHLARAVPILITLIFVVSTRSQGEYLLIFAPLWFVWIAGTHPAAVTASRPIGRSASPVLGGRRRQIALAVAALLPALACVGVAVASPGPLALAVTSAQLTGPRLTVLRVSAVNRTDHRVVPHFYVDPKSHIKSPWRIVSGPSTLRPGQRATLTLRPGVLGPQTPASGLRVWALSDAPTALSSVALTVPRSAITVDGAPGAAVSAVQSCERDVLAGHDRDCGGHQ